jgi:hypothetical protein
MTALHVYKSGDQELFTTLGYWFQCTRDKFVAMSPWEPPRGFTGTLTGMAVTSVALSEVSISQTGLQSSKVAQLQITNHERNESSSIKAQESLPLL